MTPTDLHAWRKRLDFTQVEAADALGRSRRSYQRLEDGTAPISRETELACAAIDAGLDIQAGVTPVNTARV